MKDKLLYYSGGGYDGCTWEWNFCFWDGDGVWHDIYSSGCAGADTEAKAKIAVNEPRNELVDLLNIDSIRRFQQDYNAHHVYHIIKILIMEYGYDIQLTCDCCGAAHTPDECDDQGFSDGIIACPDCFCNQICDYCGEFFPDKDDLIYFVEHNPDKYGRICVYCYEENKNHKEMESLQDLRFQSLLTGSPDMFSDKLRSFWD